MTLQNNGDLPWTRAQQYTLMSQNPDNNMSWGLNWVPLPVETVNPGESATFRFTVTAPATANWYMSQWGMQREGGGSFGRSSNGVWVEVTEPVNNAQPTGQNVSTQMETNKPYTASVTMVNNGESTWTREKQYTLMSQNPPNNTTWGNNRVPLPVDHIAPGQSVTFNFPITAPNTAGDHVFQWSMQREGYGSFGSGTTPVTVNVTAPVNNAQVVSVSVQPRMQTKLGYTVAVTMKNTGTTTWSQCTNYKLGSLNWQDNLIWGLNRVPVTTSVAPGQTYTFNFNITAPALGNYDMQWGMVQEGVDWFGTTTSNAITVTEDLSSVTFIHTDGLGSPVARTDGNGNLVSRTRYEPYGLVASGATPTIGFTGHVNDADTGLTYMQQRYYDPVAGRFLSVDPVVTDATTGKSFNRYVYANNNPFKYIDPDGRDAAERFVEQHRKDMEAGNGEVYKPLAPIALAGTGIALAATGAAAGAAAGPPLLAAAVKVLAPKVESIAGKELTKQELRSVKSLAKQMEKHEQKLEDFKANPTVRPGMEHMPQERIQAQQAQRAEDIKVEIQRNFVDKIMDILGH